MTLLPEDKTINLTKNYSSQVLTAIGVKEKVLKD
jgi:hypothetical protein